MAFCHHHLDQNDRAHQRFEEAYELDPENPKTIANRAFGLLLDDRAQDAYAFATEQFERDPGNAPLAVHLIQAHYHAKAEGRPWESMSASVLQDEAVALAQVQWLRWSGESTWIEKVRSVGARVPDNEALRTFAAEADLEEVLTACRSKHRFPQGKEAVRLRAAADTLADRWREAESSERAVGEIELSTLHNTLFGYHLVGAYDPAVELAKASTAWLESSSHLRKIVAMIALERGEADLIDRALEEGFDGDTDLRLERELQRENWSNVLAIIEDEQDALHEAGAHSIDTLKECIRLTDADEADRMSGFDRLADAEGRSAHELLLVSQFAQRFGFGDAARKAIERAAGAVDDETFVNLRSQIALQAHRCGASEAVIAVLEDLVDPTAEAAERRWLASAYAAATPRRRAEGFFEKARKSGTDDFGLHATEGQYHFNRGRFDLALPRFERALEIRPESVQVILALWQTLMRRSDDEEAGRLIVSLTPGDVEGPAPEKMNLAQLMLRHGRADALEFAYDLASANPNDPDVLKGYAGLFFMGLHEGIELPLQAAKMVTDDVWVRIANEDGKEMIFTVSTKSDPSGRHLPPSHPMVREALKKSKDETFTGSNGLQSTEWRITELKPKHLALFHDITETFEHRFPGQSAFHSVTLRGDDLSPVFEQVKARGELAARTFDDYVTKKLPLGIAARTGGGSAIDFAVSLTQSDRRLITAAGYVGEAEREAVLVVRASKAGQVVLDAYTVWLLASTGLLGVVKRICGDVLLPRSAIDELGRMLESMGTGERMSLAWDGTNYVRSMMSEEDVARARSSLEDIRNDIERQCKIVGTEVEDGLPPELIEVLGLANGALDAAVVAHREEAALMSADMHLRNWAVQLFGSSTFGLKGALDVAYRQSLLKDARLAEVAVDLGCHAHNHISFNAATLVHVLDGDETPELFRLQVVCRYLGGPNAEYESHVDVAAAFVSDVHHRLADVKVRRAVSTVLRAIVRLEGRTAEHVVADVYRRSGQLPLFGQYARGWLKGHFLVRPPENAEAA